MRTSFTRRACTGQASNQKSKWPLLFTFRRCDRSSSTRGTGHRLGVMPLEDRCVPAGFTVNSLLDTASPPAGVTTLRSAIIAANADHNTDLAHPDTIGFSVAGTIALASQLPAITGAVSIQGPGASGLTVLLWRRPCLSTRRVKPS